jgi:hypothetical protein
LIPAGELNHTAASCGLTPIISSDRAPIVMPHPEYHQAAEDRAASAAIRTATEVLMLVAERDGEPGDRKLAKPIAETRTHAGIVKVNRYGLDIR